MPIACSISRETLPFGHHIQSEATLTKNFKVMLICRIYLPIRRSNYRVSLKYHFWNLPVQKIIISYRLNKELDDSRFIKDLKSQPEPFYLIQIHVLRSILEKQFASNIKFWWEFGSISLIFHYFRLENDKIKA